MMERSCSGHFLYVNRCLITTNTPRSVASPYTILVNVGVALWNGLMEDEAWKDSVQEADIADPEEQELANKVHYVTEEYTWFPLDEEELFAGRIISIHIEGYSYDITINKWMLPAKLKKNEFTKIDYTVTPDHVLILRKQFDGLPNIPDSEYAMYRIFRIV